MKHWISKAALAAAMVAASSAALAADDGQFFVNGEVGKKDLSLSSSVHDVKNSGKTGSLRLGYMWNNGPVSYGLETGYVTLGSDGGSVTAPLDISPRVPATFPVKIKTSGWLFGGNAKFHFGDHWFVSGRGGLFRSNVRIRSNTAEVTGSSKSTKNGYYAGLGTGYDFNEHFGMGVNFDYYRARIHLAGTSNTVGSGYKVYGIMGEYRF